MKRLDRICLGSLLAICFLVPGCQQSAPFQKAGAFSESEKASLATFDPILLDWEIRYSAVWDQEGVVRRIFLGGDPSVGSTVSGVDVGVMIFNGDGTLLDVNEVRVHSTRPVAVLDIVPLRIKFGASEFALLMHPTELWRQRVEEKARTMRWELGDTNRSRDTGHPIPHPKK